MLNWQENLHPDLARKVTALLTEMELIGKPVRVTEGYRSLARQAWLYAQGRTRPGPKVTWTMKSVHRLGMAVDVVPIIAGKVTFDGHAADAVLEEWAKRAEARGLTAGAHWSTADNPHVQLITIHQQVEAWAIWDVTKQLARVWAAFRVTS